MHSLAVQSVTTILGFALAVQSVTTILSFALAVQSVTTILGFALAVQSDTDNDADFSLFQTDENKSSSALGKSHSTLAEESVVTVQSRPSHTHTHTHARVGSSLVGHNRNVTLSRHTSVSGVDTATSIRAVRAKAGVARAPAVTAVGSGRPHRTSEN